MENPIVQLMLRTGVNDARPAEIKEIIGLADNTFWVHYRLNHGLPFRDKFEHYDESFHLLDSAYYDNYFFGKFVVNGNNDIVVSAFTYFPQNNNGFYRFLQLDNRINIIAQDSSNDLFLYLSPIDNYISFNNNLDKLSNGNYVFGFSTSLNNFFDSSRILLASYANPIGSGKPAWVNRKKYYDYPNEIYSTLFTDLATDKQNNFYVFGRVMRLPGSHENYCFLRKHSSDGKLLWQTRFFKSYYTFAQNQIFIEPDRIIIGTIGDKLYLFDLNGNVTEKELPQSTFNTIFPANTGDGYIALSDTFNSVGHFAKVLKFDRNFNLTGTKIFGNQGTSHSAMGKLANGKYVIAAFVETPDLNDYNLLLFKIDENLNLIK